jgi:hypothetical protein
MVKLISVVAVGVLVASGQAQGLRLSLLPLRTTVKPGGNVEVRMRAVNHSRKPQTLYRPSLGSTVFALGPPLPPTNDFGVPEPAYSPIISGSLFEPLSPGESYVYKVSLSRQLDLKTPGTRRYRLVYDDGGVNGSAKALEVKNPSSVGIVVLGSVEVSVGASGVRVRAEPIPPTRRKKYRKVAGKSG